MTLLLALGCMEYSVHVPSRRDVFPQARRNQAELLFVVDNSLSMVEEHQHLGDSFELMLEPLLEADVSWQIAVTTTETLYQEYRGRLEGHRDALVLQVDGEELDRVAWDEDWAWTAGTSMALAPGEQHPDDNDRLEAWCASDEPIKGGHGSPGAWTPPATAARPRSRTARTRRRFGRPRPATS